MKKVIIIGCPGAGKSTFARALHKKTKLPLFYLDMLFWNSDMTHVSREIFDKRLAQILNQESWIIDGNYGRTMETRLKECDTVFLLDFSVDVCLSGVSERIGKAREDMPWVEQEFDSDFKQWIIDFSNIELPQVYSLLEKYSNKNILIFKSRQEIDDFLGNL